jgi:hypothetical protein
MKGLSPIMKRLPVTYLGKPLMPMKESRVRRLVEQNKAKICFNRKLHIYYVKLYFKPSGFNTQEIVLGVDVGSTFDGFTLLSNLCHHLNIEFIQRPKGSKKNSIKAKKKTQLEARRVRRSRLRHRKIRFTNRTSSKLVPTIQANVDARKWVIKQLMRHFPFAKIRVEDVKFNHKRDLVGKNRLNGKARGAPFSLVEVGKNALYSWIRETGFELELIEGYETCKMRLKYLNGVDLKSEDKSAKKFEAHCLDSFIIAGSDFNLADIELNRQTIFIEKIIKNRRHLFLNRKVRHDSKLREPHYFRYGKGGIKIPFKSISRKKNVCRVKAENEHSNHPKEWTYIDNGYATKNKHETQRQGGTSLKGSRKFFKNNEWFNRKIEIIN